MLQTFKRFANSDGGNVGLMFALLLVPSLLATALAVDYGRAAKVKQTLQASVDAAALAASASTLSDEAAEVLADRTFDANMAGVPSLKNIKVTSERSQSITTVSASVEVPTTLSAMLMPTIKLASVAKAKSRTDSGPLCILGLNAHADRAIRVWGTGDLLAPSCAVHANSDSSIALVSGGSATARAQSVLRNGRDERQPFRAKREERLRFRPGSAGRQIHDLRVGGERHHD